MARKRLIIHIGMHKTGSTSIQRFLSRNRLALRLAGVLYPTSYGADGRREPKHNALFSAISHEADFGAPHPDLGPSNDMIAEVGDSFARSRAQTAILSAEGFSGEKPAFARALAPLGRRFDTRIVVYLRRPDQWVESFYRQMILSSEVREARPLNAFLASAETRAHLDYCRMLGWWAAEFGANAIVAMPYRNGADGELLQSFLAAAAISRHFALLPHSRARLNRTAPSSILAARWRTNGGRGPLRQRLTPEERVELATRLIRENDERRVDPKTLFPPPPFIYSMLEAIMAESDGVQDSASPFFGQNPS